MATTDQKTTAKPAAAAKAKAPAAKTATKATMKATGGKAIAKTAAKPKAAKTPSQPRTPKQAQMTGNVTVRQTKSSAGRIKSQQDTLLGLGLGRIGKTRTLQATPAIQGMINKVAHLIAVDQTATSKSA